MDCSLCKDPTTRVRSKYCEDCKDARGNFASLLGNLKSGYNRSNKGSPAVYITKDEFALWRKIQPKYCHYCGISEESLPKVGMKSQVQHNVRILGVDRIDSNNGYLFSNMTLCCFVCNQIKGNRFSESEMHTIALGISSVWDQRLRQR